MINSHKFIYREVSNLNAAVGYAKLQLTPNMRVMSTPVKKMNPLKNGCSEGPVRVSIMIKSIEVLALPNLCTVSPPLTAGQVKPSINSDTIYKPALLVQSSDH